MNQLIKRTLFVFAAFSAGLVSATSRCKDEIIIKLAPGLQSSSYTAPKSDKTNHSSSRLFHFSYTLYDKDGKKLGTGSLKNSIIKYDKSYKALPGQTLKHSTTINLKNNTTSISIHGTMVGGGQTFKTKAPIIIESIGNISIKPGTHYLLNTNGENLTLTKQ